ncbi:ABC transporter D family member 2, chloroplastic [Brassica rapa]|uniref:ABC transporter domain-containing protein n=1 Tax=Brassica campestris TaxID=3711 RepID=M4EXL1_BRACM|nr:ABC transporter D family member 2, chloroplastic [Brassica rapa]
MILITAPPFPTPCSHLVLLRHLHLPPPPPLRHESTIHRSKISRFRRRVSAVSSSSSSSLLPQPPRPDKASELRALWKRFWKVAAPYWFSEDKDQARLRLAAVFALTLATTGISVGFNFLGRDFYNALSNKDQEQFTKQLLYYLCGFAGGIPFFVLRDYAKETLSLRWRSWMTKHYLQRYLKDQTFYKIQSQSMIDNPDQRIVDDLSSFTSTALSFSLTLFSATIDLISFSNILFTIYPPLFLLLLVYSLGGTAISVFIGKGLVNLNFMQEKKEADFRYNLVRVRENAESIAFYGGEQNEMQLLLERFRSAFDNLTELLIASRNLEFFTDGYRYLIQILPAALVAPMFFSGKIEFGVINQSVSAFNHILGDFSLVVYQFQAISAFSAVIDRLGEFDDLLDNNITSHTMDEIELTYQSAERSSLPVDSNGSSVQSRPQNQKLLEIEELTLQTPTNRTTLLHNLTAYIYDKDHLLIMGPSGSGKTSLLRAMAGLWRSGKGRITFYLNPQTLENSVKTSPGDVLFLPQRPYMVLGTLRQQLLYPAWTTTTMDGGSERDDGMDELKKPTTDDLMRTLKNVRLGHIVDRFGGLDSFHEWSSVLSLGEQQRLAFARLLLCQPKLALLDESTSALDEANEAHLYQQIQSAGITYISIGHRQTLTKFHNKILHISTADPKSIERNWRITEDVNAREDSLLNQ